MGPQIYHWGWRPRRQRGWFRALYRLRFFTALTFSLPFLVGVAWYAWSGFAKLDRYRRLAQEDITLDADLMQLALHDTLTADLRRLTLQEAPEPSKLPLFELSLQPDAVAILEKDAENQGKRTYVEGLLRKDGKVYKVDIRHQGVRHWHGLGVQKSMKIRAERGELVDGVRVFNLINDVTPFGLEEELILDLAREKGLLTPEYLPVRVRLNNRYLGIYRFEAQPDEGLLRRNRRMPGSLYSGAYAAPCQDALVPGVPCGWDKAAFRDETEKENYAELNQLLDLLRSADHATMAHYAAEYLSLEQFALLEALDVAFGGDQHDNLSNVKLYFDAFRGRFEPVARDFRAFTHEPRWNLAENNLQLRLKLTADYVWRRDRALYQLLLGEASVQALRERADRWFEALLPELRADPHWDAYKLLPRATRFHRFMVRPMTVHRWLLASTSELDTYAQRHRYLLDLLEARVLVVRGGKADKQWVVEVEAGGHEAVQVENLTVEGPSQQSYLVWADTNLDGVWSAEDTLLAQGVTNEPLRWRHRPLTAGQKLVTHDNTVAAEPEARTYRYFIRGENLAPRQLALILESRVTGASSRHLVAAAAPFAPQKISASRADEVPRLVAGEAAPHPWLLGAEPLPETVVLGPGLVEIDQTRHYRPHQTVKIQPGTELRLGPQVSLIFEGPLFADGRVGAPIWVKRKNSGQPWGGWLIRGPKTQGTRLNHLVMEGGSHPAWAPLYTPGLLDFRDTQDIRLENLHLLGVTLADDVIHATYVKDITLNEVTIAQAPVDALDLEHSTAALRGLRVLGAGDECLDLMSTQIRILDSLLLGCQNNGISGGEETQITLHGSAIVRAKVGVLAKNASTARISRSLFYSLEEALRTNKKDVYYATPSAIDAQDIYAVECVQVARAAKNTQLRVESLHQELPEWGRLRYLEEELLGLSGWAELEARLQVLGGPP